MYEIGRVCVKLTGRDAGKKCVIIDIIDSHFVLIDGQTRRRKCNIKHLEPLNQVLQVTKEAPVPEVVRVLKEIGIEVKEKSPKAKPSRVKAERPKRMRKTKEKPVKEPKAKEAKAKEKPKIMKADKKADKKKESAQPAVVNKENEADSN